MNASGTVLVVDDEDPSGVESGLGARGLDVEVATDLASAVAALPGEFCCVVCGQLAGHTVAETVTHLERTSVPVVVLYDEEESATTALDAGARTTLPRREPEDAWGAHLAATVDSIRRREATGGGGDLLSEALDELQDPFFVVSVDGTFLRWNQAFTETTGYEDETIAEMQPTDFFEGEDVERIENAIGRVVVNGRATEVADLRRKDGPAIPHQFTGALVDANGTQAIVGTARDVRDRRERERELEAQTRRLEALNHVNSVIRNVVRAMLGAGTRERIAAAVCEELTAGDAYRFAWVGSYDADSDRVEPDAWAGAGETYLEERPDDPSGADRATTALTALRERSVRFAEDVAESQEAAQWRAAALAAGHESAAAVPLVYDDATYGCLCLYRGEPGAFDALERDVLAELGELIGHAIHAAETQRALTTDTVTEVQFRVVDEDAYLAKVAAEIDAEMELVGSAGQPDDSIVQLFEVRGLEPSTLREYVEASPAAAEVVTERESECVVRVTVEEYSTSHVLAEVGGTVNSVTIADGEVTVTVDIPPDVDVKGVLESIEEVQDVELLARREVERADRPDVDFRADVERHLTERQLEVLETSYRAGFFDWPREQTGEDVAELLDVSPPTFHQHRRVGERKLLEVLFDREPAGLGSLDAGGQPAGGSAAAGADESPEGT